MWRIAIATQMHIKLGQKKDGKVVEGRRILIVRFPAHEFRTFRVTMYQSLIFEGTIWL